MNQLPFNDIAGIPEATRYSSQQDTNVIASSGLKDSLNLWLYNKQSGNIEGMLSFYHNSFKFPGGTLSNWEEKLKNDSVKSSDKKVTLYMKNIREIKHGEDYIEIAVTVVENIAQEGSSESNFAMIWRKSEKGWKIIRERLIIK